jgi:hypothetical protein
MSVEYITQKINDTHLSEAYHTKNMESDTFLSSKSLTICVNIKDQYNRAIYDVQSSSYPIIYTENESSGRYNLQLSISPQPTLYVCPSPPRANKNRSFCWSHALK